MKRTLLYLLVAALILIFLIVYRSRFSGNRLNVTPDAAREIEKAKRR
jgi:hypothetical protein